MHKNMAAGALVFRGAEMLIVKPTYKHAWHVPGGMIDPGEGPREACEREILEEVGLKLSVRELLVVDYRHNRGTSHPESLQFIFLAEDVDDELLRNVQLPDKEIAEWRLVSPDEALVLLEPYLAKRIRIALDALRRGERGVYIESGERVFG